MSRIDRMARAQARKMAYTAPCFQASIKEVCKALPEPEMNPPMAHHQAEKEIEKDLRTTGLKLPAVKASGGRLGKRAQKAIMIQIAKTYAMSSVARGLPRP